MATLTVTPPEGQVLTFTSALTGFSGYSGHNGSNGGNGASGYSGAMGLSNGPASGDLSGNFPDPTVISGAHLGAQTVPDSALSTNVPLLNAENTFTKNQTITCEATGTGLYISSSTYGQTILDVNGAFQVLNNGIVKIAVDDCQFGNGHARVSYGNVITNDTAGYYWTGGGNIFGANDTGLARNAAGVIEINNGTTVANSGGLADIKANHFIGDGSQLTALPNPLVDGSAIASIDYLNRHLDYPTSGNIGLDWSTGNVVVYASDGVTVIADFGSHYLTNGIGSEVDWNASTLISSGSIVLNWQGQVLFDNAGTDISVDWHNRILCDSTGTALFDYSSVGSSAPYYFNSSKQLIGDGSQLTSILPKLQSGNATLSGGSVSISVSGGPTSIVVSYGPASVVGNTLSTAFQCVNNGGGSWTISGLISNAINPSDNSTIQWIAF